MNVKRRLHETRTELAQGEKSVIMVLGSFFFVWSFSSTPRLVITFYNQKKNEENRYYVTNNCCMFGWIFHHTTKHGICAPSFWINNSISDESFRPGIVKIIIHSHVVRRECNMYTTLSRTGFIYALCTDEITRWKYILCSILPQWICSLCVHILLVHWKCFFEMKINPKLQHHTR